MALGIRRQWCASALQAQEAARIAGLLEHQALKGAQLQEAKKARDHANRKKILERSVDLANKRDKVWGREIVEIQVSNVMEAYP